MKSKTSILITLIVAIMFAMTGCSSKALNAITETTPDTAFKEVRVEKVGNHIYIEENFCEKRMREDQKKEIMAALEEADKLIDEDMYVYGVSESFDKSGYSFNADRYVKGVDITDAKARCDCKDGVYTWKSSSGGTYTKQDIDIDTSKVIPAEDLYKKVFDLATKHKKEMILFDEENFQIRGEYTLRYTEGRGLYYFFGIYDYSSVQVDAITGDIIEYYFFNGLYID